MKCVVIGMKCRDVVVITGMTVGVYIGIKYILPIIIPFLLGWLMAIAGYAAAGKIYKYPVMKKLHLTRERTAMGVLFLLIVLCGFFIGVLCCAGKEGIFCVWDWVKSNERLYETVLKCQHQAVTYFQSEKFVDNAKLTAEQIFSIGSVILTACLSGFFIVKDYQHYKEVLGKCLFCRKIWKVIKMLGESCRAYLKAQIRIMSVVAGICIVGLYVLGIRKFILWGLLIGILDALPILGVGIVLIPWAVYAWWQNETLLAFGMVLLFFSAMLTRQFLEPKWIGNQLGIRPLYVLASIYFGIVLYGGFGLFLGPVSALLLSGLIREWKAV